MVIKMPLYEFRNSDTGETFERRMKIIDKEKYLSDNPRIKQLLHAPNIVRSVSVKNKLGGFNEVLQKVGESNPGSDVDRQVNRRTAKEVATVTAVKKQRDKNV